MTPLKFTEARIKGVYLNKWPDTTTSGTAWDVNCGKPEPDIYVLIMNRSGSVRQSSDTIFNCKQGNSYTFQMNPPFVLEDPFADINLHILDLDQDSCNSTDPSLAQKINYPILYDRYYGFGGGGIKYSDTLAQRSLALGGNYYLLMEYKLELP